jgi:hypothetical protein
MDAQAEARLLPVPYYLLTVTVPAELREVFLLYPQELYPLFFAAVAESVKEICSRRKHLGGDPGSSRSCTPGRAGCSFTPTFTS